MPTQIKAVVLTISDTGSAGARTDVSGPEVVAGLVALNAEIIATEIIPDDRELISARLRHFADSSQANLIVTTGGTGLSRRDVTPEATKDVIDREAPGLAELMRAEGVRITPLAALSRAVCGTRGQTLIINLPGSVRGARENLAAVSRLLTHAVTLVSA